MKQFMLVLAVCGMVASGMLTGTMSVGADPIMEGAFDAEFMKYVTTPCMTALAEKSGAPEFFPKDMLVTGADQWALLEYRFGKTQLSNFSFHLEKQKIYLSKTLRKKPLHVRKAWYAVTVQLCKQTLPD